MVAHGLVAEARGMSKATRERLEARIALALDEFAIRRLLRYTRVRHQHDEGGHTHV